MTKYFMANTPQAELERQMMTPPGFTTRCSGQTTSSRFKYKPEDVACQYCTECRHRKCTAPVCLYVPERLEAGAITYQELVRIFFFGMNHAALARRIDALTSRHSFGYRDSAHQYRLEGCLHGELARPSRCQLAALYLLTAKSDLWRRTASAIRAGQIDYSEVRQKDFDIQSYALYRTAKGISDMQIILAPDALADPTLIGDDILWLIINAALIARYGKDVFSIESNEV